MTSTPLVDLLDSRGLSKFGESFSKGEALRLLDFARNSVVPEGGFGYLDLNGEVDRSHPRELYVQCRMIQVFGLGYLLGLTESLDMVNEGVDALFKVFLDVENSGFFNSVDYLGNPVDDNKLAYGHAFVLLAASTAKACKHPRADDLLKLVDHVIDSYFWEPTYGMLNNSWNKEFSICDPYRGVNANMHGVEAFIAAYDVTGDQKYRDRALVVSKKVVDGFAKTNSWMMPEHFDSEWKVDYKLCRDI